MKMSGIRNHRERERLQASPTKQLMSELEVRVRQGKDASSSSSPWRASRDTGRERANIRMVKVKGPMRTANSQSIFMFQKNRASPDEP